jgi:hypothetical protein
VTVDQRPAPPWTRPDVRIGAVIAVALAIAFIVWLIVRGGGSSKPAQTTGAPTATTPAVAPKLASEADLRALAVQSGHPIYWVGPEPGHVYELTRTSTGNIFVRYLTKGAKVGTPTHYTFVGTYPVSNALRRLKAQARSSHDVTFSAPGGGFAAYAPKLPTNIYVAFPNSSVQIEVFDPSAKRARSLVASGQIAPVR